MSLGVCGTGYQDMRLGAVLLQGDSAPLVWKEVILPSNMSFGSVLVDGFGAVFSGLGETGSPPGTQLGMLYECVYYDTGLGAGLLEVEGDPTPTLYRYGDMVRSLVWE